MNNLNFITTLNNESYRKDFIKWRSSLPLQQWRCELFHICQILTVFVYSHCRIPSQVLYDASTNAASFPLKKRNEETGSFFTLGIVFTIEIAARAFPEDILPLSQTFSHLPCTSLSNVADNPGGHYDNTFTCQALHSFATPSDWSLHFLTENMHQCNNEKIIWKEAEDCSSAYYGAFLDQRSLEAFRNDELSTDYGRSILCSKKLF